MTHPPIQVTGGVDTHKDTHTAAAVDDAGRVLGSRQFDASATGYRALACWLRSFGTLVLVGVYGAGLTHYLTIQGVPVVEIDRNDRKARRWQGKSDPVDAEAAARAALTRRRTGIPKRRDGRVECPRVLRVARRSAAHQRADVLRQIKMLTVSAPERMRAGLRGLSDRALLDTCAAFDPTVEHADQPEIALRLALCCLAKRHQQLSHEIRHLDGLLAPLVATINPALLALNGVGTEVAGQLLVTAGDNPQRLRSEAAFAMLCGVAPLPASSGKTSRHRLNRGGDRQANAALYRIALCRLRWDPRTRAYMERRTKDGLSKKEIIRCLKQYIAREIYQALTRAAQAPIPA